MNISDASLGDRNPHLFKLSVKYFANPPSSVNGSSIADVEEVYDNLSPDPSSGDYYIKQVNGASQLVKLFAGNSDRPRDTDGKWIALEDGTDDGESTKSTTNSTKPSDDKKKSTITSTII